MEDVYDVRVPGVNAFDANGLYVHNCGEQPLLPYEACNLGSINLSLMVRDGQIDWEELRRVVHLAVRFLDDTIEATVYPIPRIDAMAKGNRKIGLGVMGWAEMLIQIGLAYDSEEAVDSGRQVMAFIDRESKEASARLGRGTRPLPQLPRERLRPARRTAAAQRHDDHHRPDRHHQHHRRHHRGDRAPLQRGLCPPDHGQRPPDRGQSRSSRAWPGKGASTAKELIDAIADRGTLDGFAEIPEDIRRLFVTAHEIAPEWHLRMQAAFQEHTDNAVSKTVNFPREATPAEVEKAYHLAFKLRCKGVTVYRDGSIENQPMQKGAEKKPEPLQLQSDARHVGEWGKIQPVHRPVRLTGITDARTTPEGNLYLTLNLEGDHPFELFAQIGKAGSDITAFTEAIARLISLCFRCGIDPEAVADQLVGIGGSRSVGLGPHRVRSVPDAIGQFLYDYLNNPTPPGEGTSPDAIQGRLDLPGPLPPSAPPAQEDPPGNPAGVTANGRHGKIRFNLCPACGQHTFGNFEGCAKCLACGYSEC